MYCVNVRHAQVPSTLCSVLQSFQYCYDLAVSMLPVGSTVVLVTSAFHLARAKRLFERQGLGVLPFAVDFQANGAWAGHPLGNPLSYFPTAYGLQSSSRAIREAIGRTVYRAW